MTPTQLSFTITREISQTYQCGTVEVFQHPTILIPLPKWVPFNNHPRSRELVSVLQVIGSLLEGDAARRGLKAEAGWEPFGWIFMLVFETGGSVYNKMCGVKPYGDVVENGIIK